MIQQFITQQPSFWQQSRKRSNASNCMSHVSSRPQYITHSSIMSLRWRETFETLAASLFKTTNLSRALIIYWKRVWNVNHSGRQMILTQNKFPFQRRRSREMLARQIKVYWEDGRAFPIDWARTDSIASSARLSASTITRVIALIAPRFVLFPATRSRLTQVSIGAGISMLLVFLRPESRIESRFPDRNWFICRYIGCGAERIGCITPVTKPPTNAASQSVCGLVENFNWNLFLEAPVSSFESDGRTLWFVF